MTETKITENENARIEPAFKKNNIPLCLFSSNQYAPYCGVLVQSVIEHSTQGNNYDIIIMERDISENNKRLMLSLIDGRNNFSIRFLNMTEWAQKITAKYHAHFKLEGSLKIYLLSEAFSTYDKFVATDSDLVFNRDLAELYNTDVEGNYMAAVDDVIMKFMVRNQELPGVTGDVPEMSAGQYISNYLGIGCSDVYYNTGVVVFNLKKCRDENIFEKALYKLNEKTYWYFEQDVLNELCNKYTVKLDLRWNVLNGNNDLEGVKDALSEELYNDFLNSLNDYYIMHFAGNHKPWFELGVKYSERFFKVARNTPWYEQIIFDMNIRGASGICNSRIQNHVQIQHSKPKSKLRKIFDKLFPPHTKKRELIKGIFGKTSFKWIWHYIKIPFTLRYMRLAQYNPFSSAFGYKKAIKKLKDSCSNKRCFIIGNGPSLCKEDVELLSNEITFAANNIFPMFENTEWRPTYYYYHECEVFGSSKEMANEKISKIIDFNLNNVFVPFGSYSRKLKRHLKEKCFVFPFVQDWCMYKNNLNYMGANYSKDCSKKIYGAFTSLYSIVQIAAYMGFKEIYFIGTDCNYKINARHFYETSKDNAESKLNTVRKCKADTNGVMRGFTTIQKALAGTDVKVYNATRGGRLELFPRVDLEDVVSN